MKTKASSGSKKTKASSGSKASDAKAICLVVASLNVGDRFIFECEDEVDGQFKFDEVRLIEISPSKGFVRLENDSFERYEWMPIEDFLASVVEPLGPQNFGLDLDENNLRGRPQ